MKNISAAKIHRIINGLYEVDSDIFYDYDHFGDPDGNYKKSIERLTDAARDAQAILRSLAREIEKGGA